MEPRWHRTPTSPPNSQAEARWRPALQLPRLPVSDKSGGGMACRYRPRQACATHRWPPSGGFQCSFLSRDKLFNRLLFYEFTLRSLFQKRLRKILGLSRSTLRQNSALWKVARSGLGATEPPPRLSASPQCQTATPAGTGGSLQAAAFDLWIIRSDAITNRNSSESEGRTSIVVILVPFYETWRSKWAETLKKAPFSSPEKCLFAVKFQKWALPFENG